MIDILSKLHSVKGVRVLGSMGSQVLVYMLIYHMWKFNLHWIGRCKMILPFLDLLFRLKEAYHISPWCGQFGVFHNHILIPNYHSLSHSLCPVQKTLP